MRIRWIYKGVVADVEERVHQVLKNQLYLEILLILNEFPGDAIDLLQPLYSLYSETLKITHLSQ